jgi:2-oxoglutarate dehydrogenase E2 component (dihydrolipoamide succinyltransferase)
VTPLVRKIAFENGIDLGSVTGTGVGGRIRREDIEAAATGSIPVIAAVPVAAPSPVVAAAPAVQVSALRGQTEPMSRLRKVLAERAVASMQASAQLTTVVEVDVTRIAQLRQRVQADFTAKTGVKLNFMPFFTLAAAEALKAHPKLNASIEGDSIVYHPTENISFAVDSERGLLTPVIREAGSLNLAQIASQIADLAARTRSNQLKPDELGGGTFTLTNTGSRGALFDTPVVFLPQVAILGTGIVSKRPVVVTDENGNDSIAIRSMVYLALSYDHRLVDGADASRFLVDVKARLENAAFEGNLGI